MNRENYTENISFDVMFVYIVRNITERSKKK